LFTALAIAIHWCLLSAAIACPPAARLSPADTGPAAASHPPAEPLLPLVALYFVMADIYVVTLVSTPSSHCCSCHHHCHCIVIVSCLAMLTEESLQKKKTEEVYFNCGTKIENSIPDWNF
jgi:hypothetical protein